ncbi:MAG: sulfite exporter TauE/SafE family protein [Candidatus Binatia bacterium]
MNEPLTSFGIPSNVLVWQAVFFTTLSFAVGILGGAVGLALGTIRLPFLLLLGMPPRIAAGTNILVSTLAAATGSYRHFLEGRVDFYAVAIQGIPAMMGAFIGGFAGGQVPEEALILAAGILVVWQGIELSLRARRGQKTSSATITHTNNQIEGLTRWTAARIAAEAIVGFGIGLLAGAVGLILGTLRLPALIMILHISPHIAVGSNLVIGFLMGGFGWVGHVTQGQVDYAILGLMAVTGMAGTYYGAQLTGKMSPRGLLSLMAVVLVVVGLLLIRDAYGRF